MFIKQQLPVGRYSGHNAVDGYPFTRNTHAAYDLRMPPRRLGSRIFFIVLLASSAGFSCSAERSPTPEAVRYHFGDGPDGKLGWANPNFDDSIWPVAKDGRWPMPSIGSDGFVWVRAGRP